MISYFQRGVSLVEALVALVVMAIGATAVVGLQVSVRANSDLAKQRSEAVRLAQDTIEDWRSFVSLAAVAGKRDWTDMASVSAATPELIAGSNVTFARSIVVVARGATDDNPLSNTVHVTVTWTDRTGAPQRVDLNSMMLGTAPELAGSLSIPSKGSLVSNPKGRHPTIPQNAVDLGDGTSRFAPPGGGALRWIFDNASGVIRSCSGAGYCASGYVYRLVSGFVMFATDVGGPTPAQAEAPTDPALNVGVTLRVDVPAALPAGWFPDTPRVTCFRDVQATAIAYYCAAPVTGTYSAPDTWSGQIEVDVGLAGLTLASSIASPSSSAMRVCRYSPVRGTCATDKPLVDDTIWGAPGATASCSDPSTTPATPSRKMKNIDHPLVFANVSENLINKNYLVIRAGSGSTAFDCPTDDTTSPNINGTTRHHQPSS